MKKFIVICLMLSAWSLCGQAFAAEVEIKQDSPAQASQTAEKQKPPKKEKAAKTDKQKAAQKDKSAKADRQQPAQGRDRKPKLSANASSQTITTQTTPKESKEPKAPKTYCPHRIHLYLGSGYANPMYFGMKESFVHTDYSINTMFELKYAYFFAPKWGFSIGAGISHFAARNVLNFSGMIPHYNDPYFSPAGSDRYYDLYYRGNDLVEKQQIWALETPFSFHFEHKIGKHGIFASLGAKGYFPLISARSVFPTEAGSLTLRGYEEFTNTWYDNLPLRMGERDARTVPAKVKMRYSVDITAEFGGVMRIADNCDFYLGVYGSYSFLDILPKAANKKDFITSEPNNTFTVNSPLATGYLTQYNQYVTSQNLGWKKVQEKWNVWQVGLKIGFHIKPCLRKDRSARELQKDFYEKVPKQMQNLGRAGRSDRDTVYIKELTSNTVVVRDTVFVYNTTPVDYMSDQKLTQSEKDNITALSNVLANSKVLFGLDQDVPKIENPTFITETANILRKDPGLELIIEGYTCDLGTEVHNRDLAARRANAVRALFIEKGVSPTQIRVSAYTYSDIQSQHNINQPDRQQHRAVIFRIAKK
jgi:outer membrane protein OmpA-like peptidoglycan-associated protein